MATIAIIGGGPAGLATANALSRANVDVVLYDIGAPLTDRAHDRAEQLGIGIGGAGLFSDGKFSFFPSGTALYRLADSARLDKAYASIADQLAATGISPPPFPTNLKQTALANSGFAQKDYSSQYGSLAQRIQLTNGLTTGLRSHQLKPFHCAKSILKNSRGYEVTFTHTLSGHQISEEFEALVIATGRFGGPALQTLFAGELPLDEQRYELGIRIEHPNGAGFLKPSGNADVKLISRQSDVEVRTFCTCRHGEVWLIPYDEVSALSGRSDGPPTPYSNFGLLPRFAGNMRGKGRAIWHHFASTYGGARAALWQPLPDFVRGRVGRSTTGAFSTRPWHPRKNYHRGNIAEVIHRELRAALGTSIDELMDRFPDLDSTETVCLFPAIEGVGVYPLTDATLKVPGENIWCCGDVVGRFRGLIPALVSGQYIGMAFAEGSVETAGASLAERQP